MSSPPPWCTIDPNSLRYKNEKAELLAAIESQNKRKKEAREIYLHQSNLLVKIRSALQQLSQKCSIIKTKPDKAPKAEGKVIVKPDDALKKKRASAFAVVPTPPPYETEGNI